MMRLSLICTLLLLAKSQAWTGRTNTQLHASALSDLGNNLSGNNAAATKTSNLPPVDWDWKQVAEKVFVDSQKPIILFDGVCNFCNGGVNLCLDWDPDFNYRYASLQSKVGQSLLLKHGKAHNDLSSIVLVTPTKAYFMSDAVLQIATKLQGLPAVLRMAASTSINTVPSPVRHALYHFVAERRYAFGTTTTEESCRLDLDGNLSQRFVNDGDYIEQGSSSSFNQL